MIGRDEQIAQARRFIASVNGGASTSNVLFVTGEAGIGKTTLLSMITAACSTIEPPPLTSMTECSTPLAGLDLGEVEALEPWAQLMAKLATAPSRYADVRTIAADLALAWVRVIPIVGDVIESLADTAKIVQQVKGRHHDLNVSGTASQQQLFQQYVNFLGELSKRTPLVLMLDDFHWADASSTNLLFAAARQLLGRPITFIVAYRPDDAASSRAGEGHPIIHVRNELERYGMCEEIGIPHMTHDDLELLLRQRYATYVSDDAFELWLARASGGNALFITQYLQTLEEDGMIDAAGAIAPGFENIRAPASAQAVVAERIRRLDEPTRELLRYASVEGDTFTSLVLLRISDVPQLKALQQLRQAQEKNGLVRTLGKMRVYSSETSAWQFAHMLLQKTVYDQLLDEEREVLHAAVLEVLKEELAFARKRGMNLQPIAVRVALHAEMLGDYDLAATLMMEGANATWRDFAEVETMKMLDGVERMLDQSGASENGNDADRAILRAQLHLKRSDVHRMRGRLSDGLVSAQAAIAAIDGIDATSLRAEALNDVASIHRMRSEHDDAFNAATQALGESRRVGDRVDEQRALMQLGHIESNRGSKKTALEWYEQGHAVAREAAPDSTHEASALNNIGAMHSVLGDPKKGLEHYQRSEAILERGGGQKLRADVRTNIGVLKFEMGDFEGARECYEWALDTYRTVGDLPSEGIVRSNLGGTMFHLGDDDAALDHLQRALEIARIVGDRRSEASTLNNIAAVANRIGDRDLARATLLEALAIHEASDNTSGIAATLRDLAMQDREDGDFTSPQGRLDRALELARQIGQQDLIGSVLSEMGLLAESSATELVGVEAIAVRVRAVGLLREAESIQREIGHPGLAETEAALARLVANVDAPKPAG